ncbi:hypothetical protein [Ideonella sp. BN130291]|uniref:hypothetical protein n=1 Tax=Ideonella sp. BN130291 TaxID=3112940 RepID=UPI002E26327F|nr:hypothetical protein [Ideonella sp. BN130291]
MHVLARERFLLPAWRKVGWKDLSSECLAAHFDFKRALADMLVSPPGKPQYVGHLAAFMRATAVQRDIDQRILVPSLRTALPLAERRLVFNDIELLYASHTADGPPQRSEASPWHDLVNEAQVVLSSLPSAMPGGADQLEAT